VQRAFSAAAADKPITFEIDMPFTTHNIDGPDLKVTTSKSTSTGAPPSVAVRPSCLSPQHHHSSVTLGSGLRTAS
jgi:hypothetical protein